MPLIVIESRTGAAQQALGHDRDIWVWWATPLECVSAVSRLQRESALATLEVGVALERLDDLAMGWHEIEPAENVRSTARRLLRVHSLRTADALQLSAAVLAADGDPHALDFVTFDHRLADAAQREGFHVVSPGEP